VINQLADKRNSC